MAFVAYGAEEDLIRRPQGAILEADHTHVERQRNGAKVFVADPEEERHWESDRTLADLEGEQRVAETRQSFVLQDGRLVREPVATFTIR